MGAIVLAQDDFPNPFVRQFDFPTRHGGFPRHPLDGQADATLFDAPEQITFLQHCDGGRIREIRGGRIEATGRRPFAVEIAAMARRTERGIKPFTLHDVVGSFGDRIRKTGVFPGRRWMNRTVFCRRLIKEQ